MDDLHLQVAFCISESNSLLACRDLEELRELCCSEEKTITNKHDQETKQYEETIIHLSDENEKLKTFNKEMKATIEAKDLELKKALEALSQIGLEKTKVEKDMLEMQEEQEAKIEALNMDNDDLITSLDRADSELVRINTLLVKEKAGEKEKNDLTIKLNEKKKELKKANYEKEKLSLKLMAKEMELSKLAIISKKAKSTIEEIRDTTEIVLKENKVLTKQLQEIRHDHEYYIGELQCDLEELKEELVRKEEKIDHLSVYSENRKEERDEILAKYDKKCQLTTCLHNKLKQIDLILTEQLSWKQKYDELEQAFQALQKKCYEMRLIGQRMPDLNIFALQEIRKTD